MSKKKVYDDDDGRTIADMSEIDPMPMLLPKPRRKEQQPVSESELSRQDRRAILLGSMGAVMLIAAIFLVAAFIVICLMLAAWT